MRIAFVHLSDIHLKSESDFIVSYISKIKDAILGTQGSFDACFLAVSGDIANTGAPEEYAIAERMFRELRSALLAAGIPQVEFVLIPGNHDCNFRKLNDTRTLIFENLPRYVSRPLDFNGTNFKAVIAVQEDFASFAADLTGLEILTGSELLYHLQSFTVGGRSIVFHCFNTAWLSRKNEVQAELFIPTEVLTTPTPRNAVISLAMFHHPFNWLSAVNQQAVKDYMKSNADIVLTGHEHKADVNRNAGLEGDQIDYFEAPALYDPDTGDSGFQMVECDFEGTEQIIRRFTWSGSHYTETETANWKLQRNASRPDDEFRNTETFRAHLRSVGTGFRHPRVTPPNGELVLRDIFIYPDLRHRDLEKLLTGRGKTINIPGGQLVDFIEKYRHVVIYGTDDCGKSSLAKVIYEDLRSKGLVPLLLSGEVLRGSSSAKKVKQTIGEACKEQYGAAPKVEQYLQLPREKKAVIVDDFHKARLTKKNQKVVVDELVHEFGTTVVFASDLYRLQQLANSSHQAEMNFAGFEHCDIKEFGSYHRHRLIEKWQYLGREDSEEPDQLSRLVVLTDKTVATLLGKNVLPHYPVTILTLLQLLETNESPNTANGAYGYLYEVLIKSALASSGSAQDVDLKVTYLAGIAYSMFKAKQSGLSEQEFRAAHQQYCDKYDIVRDFSRMMDELRAAEVIVESNKVYRFKYPYMYYYFVAKYLQENATSLREELHDIADHIYSDLNANVLIFYVYLTKDTELIKHLTENAKRIFEEHKPCDMETGGAEFVNKLFLEPPPELELECGDIRANRDRYNQKQDAIRDESDEDTAAAEEAENLKYDRQLQEVIKINIAFKTLQILGQVLRNFPGSLDGVVKLDITNECYRLGMRTLESLLWIAETNIDVLRQHIGGIIAERTGLTDSQLASMTDGAIIWLTVAAGHGTVKRISYAVGHQELTTTYEKALAENDTLATRIIDSAIKLDHFDFVPEIELGRLRKRVKDNRYAYAILRDLVGDFLYLYKTDFPTMQTLGSMFDIKVSLPKFLDNRSKK